MRILSLALAAVSAAAICSASPAMAQSATNDTNGTVGYNAQAQTGEQSGDSDHDWQDRRGADRRDRDQCGDGCGWRHEHWMRWHQPGRMMGGPGRMMGGRGMRAWSPPRGAHFLFEHGKSRVDIQCPAREDLGACVDAANKILNRLVALKRAAAASKSVQSGKPAGANGSVPGTPGAAPAPNPGGATKP
jgi:hypothetical protein